VFGSRLLDTLLRTTDFQIIAASRTRHTASHARVTNLALDRKLVTATVLKATGAFAVADASGPFQGADYRFARTTIEAGLHYVDLAALHALADGRLAEPGGGPAWEC